MTGIIANSSDYNFSKRVKDEQATQHTNKLTGDARILSLLKQGGSYDQGFRLLVQEYSPQLYAHVRRMVGSHEDTDDVLQNCFIKVYRNIHRFEGNSKLYTWLYRIATNEALSFLEKRKKQSTDSFDSTETTFSVLPSDPYLSEDKATRILNQAVESLPDKQKAVFNLRYYSEMSYADISETLETSQGALKASYHHAVKKIEYFVKTNMEKF